MTRCPKSPTKSHHYVIDHHIPETSSDHGVCKYCGEEREFNGQTRVDKWRKERVKI